MSIYYEALNYEVIEQLPETTVPTLLGKTEIKLWFVPRDHNEECTDWGGGGNMKV